MKVDPSVCLPPLKSSFLCHQYIHLFLNEVTALVPVLNETKHSFALYTPEKTRQRWPVRLAAATEQDMNDWVRVLLGGSGLSPSGSHTLTIVSPLSLPCSANLAARAEGYLDAHPHRPSGLSPARGTFL